MTSQASPPRPSSSNPKDQKLKLRKEDAKKESEKEAKKSDTALTKTTLHTGIYFLSTTEPK